MNFITCSLLLASCIAAIIVASAPGGSSLGISQIPYYRWRGKRAVESDGKTLDILPLDEQTEEAAGKDLVCFGEHCTLWPKELTSLVNSGDVTVESIELNDAESLESNQESPESNQESPESNQESPESNQESPELNQESKRDNEKQDIISKGRICMIRSRSGVCRRWW